MNEISKFSFYKSFNDQIEYLENPDDRLEFYEAIRLYAFYGEDFTFTNPMLEFNFIQIKTIIDADIKRKTGGAPNNNSNASKGNTCRKCLHYRQCLRKNGASELCDNFELSHKTTQNNVPKQHKTNNVNVNDNVNDNVNVNVILEQNTTLTETNKNTVPDITTEPMKNFGSLVYNEFINAGLPHEKSLIDFLFGGLKTGCEIIHHNEESKRATSQEILQAVKNYIDVLNDPKCFYSVKHSFVSFCKSEQFYKFLPSNFVKDNWYSYDAKKEAVSSKVNNKIDFNFQNIKYIDTECPNCKNKTLYLDDALNSYMCTSCKRIFDNLTTE